jgi:glutathione synthase/RimK-type ligase-like ATP-grasp enzyme
MLVRIGFVHRTRSYAKKYREDWKLLKQIMKETKRYASVTLLDFDHFESQWDGLGNDLDGICSMAHNPTTLSILSCFEILGKPVVNTVSSVRMCLDTASALVFLRKQGLPVPLVSLHRRVFTNLKFPAILKNISSFSAKTRKTIVLRSSKDYANYARYLKNGLWIAQKLLDKVTLMKVYIVGNEVISMKELEWISTNSQNDKNPTLSEITELCLSCGSRINLEVYNVELIVDRDGTWVIDINDFPSFSAIPEAPKIIAQYLKNRFKK